MTRKLMVGAALGAFVMAAVAAVLYASPYWAVHQLKKAAQERDVDALLAHVDARALRLSVRLAMGFRLNEAMTDAADEDRVPSAAGAIDAATALVDPLTDALTSPTLLMAMLIEGRPSELMGRNVLSGPPMSVKQAGQLARNDWSAELRYVDWSTVLVHSKAAPTAGDFILKRSGLVDWRLTGFQMPDQ